MKKKESENKAKEWGIGTLAGHMRRLFICDLSHCDGGEA